MIAWLVEDSVDRVFVEGRRAVIRTAKERASSRGLAQRGFKLIVVEPTKSNLVGFLNGVPPEVDRESITEVIPK
jgi:hypothetical protein